MTNIELAVTQYGTLDTNGTCLITMGPAVFKETWAVERMVVGSDSALETSCFVYSSFASLNNVIDSTGSGNNDISETSIDLLTLDKLVFQWVTGTPGKQCWVSLYGTKDTGRN